MTARHGIHSAGHSQMYLSHSYGEQTGLLLQSLQCLFGLSSCQLAFRINGTLWLL